MPSIITKSLNDGFTFSDGYDVSYRPLYSTLIEHFKYVEAFTYSFHVRTEQIFDYVQYNEHYDNTRNLYLADVITYQETYEVGQNLNQLDFFNYSEDYYNLNIRNRIDETLTYTDDFLYSFDHLITLTDTFGFADFFAGNVFGLAIPTSPNLVKAIVYLGGVRLPAPEYGDKDTFSFNRITRSMQNSGLVEIVVYPEWQASQEFTYKFRLDESNKHLLQAFLAQNIGKTLSFIDHWSRNYNVIVLNPGAEFIQDGRFMYSVELDFLCVT